MSVARRLVSVVVPTYNHVRFIGKAVESVLSQTYPDLEVIVVDNYSQDGTEQAVLSFRDPRVRYCKFSNNGVIAASRNHGIRMARGEYVAFLDSDDIWLPEKLAKQMEAFNSSESPVLVYSRYRTISDDVVSADILPRRTRCVSGDIFTSLYRGHFIACSGVLVDKNVLDRARGFDEAPELVAIEDMDLWFRIALMGRISCASPDPLFLYRVHPGGVSRGYLRRYRRVLRLLNRYSKRAGALLFLAAVISISLSVARQKCAEIMRSI